MESNATDTPDLADFEVFDYRDIVNVISYTFMSSGFDLFFKNVFRIFIQELFQLASF